MSDYIPHELLFEILIRLPVDSLVRFTGVCKSWYALITNPNFITAHLSYTNLNQKNKAMLLRYYDKNVKEENFTVRSDDDTFSVKFVQIEFPFKSPIGYFRIVGSCNGLVCLSDDLFGDMESVILWNPSIRKSISLQMPVKPQYPHMFVLGFGVCPVTNDYKVVRVVYLKDSSFSFKVPPEVHVYSLGNGSWKAISASAPSCYMVEYTWSQAFVFGSVHWIAYDKHAGGGSRNLVISFHMGDEVFKDMVLPRTLANKIVSDLSVTVLGDSLAALNYKKEIGRESCGVWVMKEYGVAESWTKLFTIRIPERLRRIIGFRNDGEVLLSFSDNELVSYDPKTDTIKHLHIFGNIRSFYVGTYMESLVLLKGHSRIIEGQRDPFVACTTEDAVKA